MLWVLSMAVLHVHVHVWGRPGPINNSHNTHNMLWGLL